MRYGERKHNYATCEVGKCLAVPEKMRKDIREITCVTCELPYRGRGHATALLEQVCAEADRMKMILLIVVNPYGDSEGMTKDQLIDWYGSRFDFHTIQADPVIMARQFNPFSKPVLAQKVSQIITEGI